MQHLFYTINDRWGISMLKKHILSLFFLISSIFFTCTSDNHQQKFNPSNVVIAWDFHDVLVKKDWSAMRSQIVSIIKNDWKLIGLALWPPFWKKAYAAKHACATSEELLHKITDDYTSLKPHWNELLKLINLHVPIPGSVEILKNLKKLEYQNYLASNMGKQSYEIQKKNFPDIFEQFDGHYIPENKDKNTGLLIGKPCTEYYIELRRYLVEKENAKDKTIIFIDDKKQNIEGAIASNHNELNHIHGIVFTSPDQLKSDLDNLIYKKIA